jgi:protein-tyrosine-phosphatase/biotin carboxylase
MNSSKVLVLGDDSRAFLAVVRSLGRHGLEVHAAPFDHGSAALRSRYIAAVHRLPPYNLDAEAWVRAVRLLLDEQGFALVVPCDDRSILPLHRHRAALGGTRLALPNEAAFTAFFDKLRTRELAARAGVAVAAGEQLAPGAEAADLVRRFGLPLAVKPRNSFDLAQIASRRTVSIVQTEAALAAALAEITHPEHYLVEAFFRGEGVGVSILAAEGEVLQAFQHQRVQESGPTGGSTYRVSVALEPMLLHAVQALAREAALHGVAMFEFRQDMATREAILIEVNARFWGSLPLAIAAGIDFPAQLYDLLAEGKRHPRVAYRVGEFARSLGNDAYRLVSDLGDSGVPLLGRLGRAGREVAVGFGRMARGRERHDTFARDDIGPWFGEWREIGAWLGGGAGRRLPALRRMRAQRSRGRFAARLAPQPGRKLRLLVLCFGNICRSPFAAALLARELAAARPDIEVLGGGFLAKENRQSPDTAIAQAAVLGIDLAPHRSRFVTDADLEAADAILVFDAQNIGELSKRGMKAADRAFLLGDFATDPGEIEDPYGQSAETFRDTYQRITTSVAAIVALLRTAG